MQMKDVRGTIRGPDARDDYDDEIVNVSAAVCLTWVKTKFVWKMLVKKQDAVTRNKSKWCAKTSVWKSKQINHALRYKTNIFN